MFTVESIDDTVARLRANGAELVGEWPSTRTSTDSATCEAPRASSSRWPRNSSEALPPGVKEDCEEAAAGEKIALPEVKDDLSRYVKLAKKEKS